MGERSDVVTLNTTEVDDAMQRLLVAANGGVAPADVTTDDVLPLVRDFEDLLKNFATKQNAQVRLWRWKGCHIVL